MLNGTKALGRSASRGRGGGRGGGHSSPEAPLPPSLPLLPFLSSISPPSPPKPAPDCISSERALLPPRGDEHPQLNQTESAPAAAPRKRGSGASREITRPEILTLLLPLTPPCRLPLGADSWPRRAAGEGGDPGTGRDGTLLLFILGFP